MTGRSPVLGVLDWGIGGLGVVNTLRSHGVGVPIVYVSDTGATAYGKLTRAQLTQRVNRLTDMLGEHGTTHLLIACNAASTIIEDLKTSLPVTGTIAPSLIALSKLSPTRIGVIGGARTIRAGIHRRGLEAAGHAVTQRIAQPLSAHVEHGTIHTERGRGDLSRIVTPLRHVQLLVLACTHYPAIASHLQTVLPGAQLFDPAVEVARVVATQLGAASGAQEISLWCTGDHRAMRDAAKRAWGSDPGPCSPLALG